MGETKRKKRQERLTRNELDQSTEAQQQEDNSPDVIEALEHVGKICTIYYFKWATLLDQSKAQSTIR